MGASFAKLRSGDWGVRIEGDKPESGATVNVTKKNGEAKQATIDTVIWSAPDQKVHLCTIQVARTSAVHKGSQGSRGGCHTDGDCSSLCSPGNCPCSDGAGWFRCC